MIIDTHCHLDYFDINFVNDLIDRAKQNNVEKMITICTEIDKIDNIINFVDQFSGTIFASLGQHPCNVDNVEISSEILSKIIDAHKNKIVGIGETGLDYYHNKNEDHLMRQKQSFQDHIEVAAKYNLPLIIHNRNSDDDVAEMLKNGVKNFGCRGVIHCFTATESFMEQMVDIGFYISISGIITFKNSLDLQQIVKKIPLNRLLIETDSPYLAPAPHRGKKNEPSFVKHTADFLADHLGIERSEFYQLTTQNAIDVFKFNI
jgi:TatD DNase family protein